MKTSIKIVAILFFVVVVFGWVSTRFKQIPPSSVGIKFNATSGLSEKLLKPELQFIGINQRLIIYPTSIKNATYVRNSNEGDRRGDDSIKASTNEGATLPVDVTVAYHVDPGNVVRAFENFGTEDLSEIQGTFVRSSAMYAVNVVSGQKSIFDLTAKDRAQFGPEVKAVLAPILLEYGITVDDVYIREVYPSQEVQNKVSESIAVRTQLDTAKNELERAKIDSATVQTNAEKQAQINALLASQGDKSIELRRLEIRKKAIEKWKAAGGEVPAIGDGTVPFTDIKIR